MTEDQYARLTFSELVAHVLSKRPGPIEGITYKTLAFRIGRRKKNGEGVAIGMGRILGKMGHMLQKLEGGWGNQIPHIQSLVIDKTGRNRGLPADGIEEFWPNYRRLTRKQKDARVQQEHKRILAFGSQWNEVLKTLHSRPSYWVVSPNVRNDEATVGAWRRASVRAQSAFMGWYPNDLGHGQIGPTFAGKTKRGIKPGDIILIARRHQHEPEIVGFGLVQGKATNRINDFKTPESFGSLRWLRPFRAWSQPPSEIPFNEVVRHTKALLQLHPEKNDGHRKVCEWIDQQLQKISSGAKGGSTTARKIRPMASSSNAKIVSSPNNHQLDYKVQTRAQAIKAKKIEAGLLEDYRRWLEQQDRGLCAIKYMALQCDAYEKDRRNLIEAKSSVRRENIRMAVGQLLDYAYQGNKKFGNPHKAILLPKEPSTDIANWLDSLEIKVIWRNKKVFLDNANGQFT